jgi:hypothetical protein
MRENGGECATRRKCQERTGRPAVEGRLTKAGCKETCFNGIAPPCFDCAQHDMSVLYQSFRDSYETYVSLSARGRPAVEGELYGNTLQGMPMRALF